MGVGFDRTHFYWKEGFYMENLLFSLNSTVPLFLVMVVGYLLRRKGMLNEGFCDAAEKFNYNYSYLSSLFRSTTGRTLSDYYKTARLKAARTLVRENKLTVSKIAEMLNYSSVYVLSRAYKAEFGVPPTEDR